MKTRFLMAALVCLTSTGIAAAQDSVALIIGNGDYRYQGGLRGGTDVTESAEAYARFGFDVVAREDATRADIADAFDEFVELSSEAERVLVILSGRYLSSSRDSWLLGVDSRSVASIADVQKEGLPLSSVLSVLEAFPGQAVLLVASGESDLPSDQLYLNRGLGRLHAPQGVTVFKGSPRAISRFADEVLADPSRLDVVDRARRYDVEAAGFRPREFGFLPAPEDGQTASALPSASDDDVWKEARDEDTVAAYQHYLSKFPDGKYKAQAEQLIEEIRTEPNRDARIAEQALGLSRDQRREIQRNLSILNFDPRGIDGLFGPGSRRAISLWQTKNGHGANGYLTGQQISDLDLQAGVRAAELEVEAERRRLEQEKRDRAFWKASGSAGDEAGLRAYLNKYPDGLFADLARERLAVIDADKREKAAIEDRAAWDQLTANDDVEGYRTYLNQYPDGAFVEAARARIDELTLEERNAEALQQAKRAEIRLGLNKPIRKVVERKLALLGLEPGPVDGEYDDDTRRAIRRYQHARGLPDTGYLTQQTVVRIFAESARK